MHKTNLITLISLAILVTVLPFYAWREPDRLAQAQAELQQEFVSEAAVIYAHNCAVCHGAAGEGIGAMPALNSTGLRTADYDFLYKTIARGRYETVMSGWLNEEGGSLNEYEVNELVALIRYAAWAEVGQITASAGFAPPTMPVPKVDDLFIAELVALDPAAAAWAAGMTFYAQNCTICHGINGEGSDLGLPLNTAAIRATPADELQSIITAGVPTTLMVGWDNVLSSADIADIVAFLKNWDVINDAGLVLTPPEPVEIDLSDPGKALAAGEQIYNSTCMACHGENGAGGIGPVLNSQQILTRNSDEQISQTIINGGRRPNSSMPAFGDRLSDSEISALVQFIRAWEPNAPTVANPRGTAQGGGPPWLRVAPEGDANITPQGNGPGQGNQGQGSQGQGNQGQGGQGQGGPPWRNEEPAAPTTPPAPGASGAVDGMGTLLPSGPAQTYVGSVVAIDGNQLTFRNSADNKDLLAMLGPPWFWEENGIELKIGDVVSLEGFDGDDHLEVNWIKNETTGQSMTLRSPDGNPVWSAQP